MAALALDLLRTPCPQDGPRRAALVLVEPPADDALLELDGVPANDGQYPARPTYHYDPAPRKIRYEEYHPYGTSAYRAVDSSVDVSPKRYRYTGMERDEETGLGYHSARYYAPWLGRWTASDPIGLAGGGNLYLYANANPTTTFDLSGMAPPGCSGVGFTTANPTAPWGCGGDQFVTFDDPDEVVGGPELIAQAATPRKEHSARLQRAEAEANRLEFSRLQLATQSPELYSIMFVRDMITVEQALKATATLYAAGTVGVAVGYGVAAGFAAANLTGTFGVLMLEGLSAGTLSGLGAGATGGYLEAALTGDDRLQGTLDGGASGAVLGAAFGVIGVGLVGSARGLSHLRPRSAAMREQVTLGALEGVLGSGASAPVSGPIPSAPAAASTVRSAAQLRQQVEALRGVGLDRGGRRTFLEGRPVATEIPSPGGDPTIITLQLGENRLTAGIFSVHNETGGGLRAFADFRGRARGLARLFGVNELEIQGQAVVNPQIEALLHRQGFQTKTVDVPEDLGGGLVDVFYKVFPGR